MKKLAKAVTAVLAVGALGTLAVSYTHLWEGHGDP